jgi:hypothetical protein
MPAAPAVRVAIGLQIFEDELRRYATGLLGEQDGWFVAYKMAMALVERDDDDVPGDVIELYPATRYVAARRRKGAS